MQDMVIRFESTQGHAQFAAAFQGVVTWGFSTRENALGGLRKSQDQHSAKIYFDKLAEILDRFWDDERNVMTREELAKRINAEAVREELFRLLDMVEGELLDEDSVLRASDVTAGFFPQDSVPEHQKVFRITAEQYVWFTDGNFNRVDTRKSMLLAIEQANLPIGPGGLR